MTDTGRRLSMTGHLEELRSRIIKAAVAVAVASLLAFLARNPIYDLLVAPYEAITGDRNLAYFRPTEAFSLFMQISLFAGFVLASPVVAYQAWAFTSPGLTRSERRTVIPVGIALGLLFVGGVAFGYWSLERGLGFLLDFGGERLDPIIGGDAYLSFALRYLLVFGIAFEFPVFVLAAAAAGVVDWRALARGRRWAVLAIVVVGAVLTPSGDPVTLLLLSAPLYLLYEIDIWLARFLIRR